MENWKNFILIDWKENKIKDWFVPTSFIENWKIKWPLLICNNKIWYYYENLNKKDWIEYLIFDWKEYWDIEKIKSIDMNKCKIILK